MDVLVAVLAVIGLVALLLIAAVWLSNTTPEPSAVEEDLAAPYRAGLHAAVRLQVAAQDLEQQMYAEAARRMAADSDAGGGGAA